MAMRSKPSNDAGNPVKKAPSEQPASIHEESSELQEPQVLHRKLQNRHMQMIGFGIYLSVTANARIYKNHF